MDDTAHPQTVRVERSAGIAGRVAVPGSKSVTNRALVICGLADGRSQISNGLVGDDADSMVNGLRTLGVEIVEESLPGEPGRWSVVGNGGRISEGPLLVDADLAGTTLRFLTAVAALGEGPITVTGREALRRRPIGPLLEALRACGAQAKGSGDSGDFAPVVVGRGKGRLGGRVAIDATQSSQFVTAMLLAAPCFEDDLVLEHHGLGARGFVELTVQQMAAHGARVQMNDDEAVVTGATGYDAADERVPPDASAASHLLALAIATGGSVTVDELDTSQGQPDYTVLEVFSAFGATVAHLPDGSVELSAPDRLSPVDVNLTELPDQLPNVAVLAALTDGPSEIRGVGVTRFHETDRVAAVAIELAKAGITVEEHGDDLVIHGGTAKPGAEFSSHGDHRMAMALAALAASLGGCSVSGADAVSKTYRDFWSDAAALGLEFEVA